MIKYSTLSQNNNKNDASKKFIGSGYAYDTVTGEIFSPGREEAEKISPVSLSKVHNSRKPFITVWKGGSLVMAKVPKEEEGNEEIGGIRKTIKCFSAASRRRFLYKLATMLKNVRWIFITLTYPDQFSEDPKVYKKQLKAFIERLKYKFPEFSGFWKLEPQTRGAPHFHFLITGIENIAELKEFVPIAWYEVVGSNDPLHLAWHKGELGNKNKHCVEEIRSPEGVMWYASKYIGKTIEQLPEDYVEMWKKIGRYWGVINREKLPAAEEVNQEVTGKEAFRFIRCMRKFMERVPKKGKRKKLRFRANRSLKLMCDANYWYERIERMIS